MKYHSSLDCIHLHLIFNYFTLYIVHFSNYSPPAPPAGSLRRSSLLFDHSDAVDAANQQGGQEVLAILEEICELSDVRPETPRLYSRLVYALRKVDARTLSSLHQRVERNAVCQKNDVMAKYVKYILAAGFVSYCVIMISGI
jgi:hypothetical protein